MYRRYLKSQILGFARILTEKLFPLFSDIEREADKHADSYYENFMQEPATEEDYIDPASIAETAFEKGLEHYEYLRLGKYNVLSSWHVTLYELFEQQVRLFLFKGMRHCFKLNFGSFCRNIKETKEAFLFHNLDIETFSCWPVIDELRLVCNVAKHGEGNSAEDLRQLNPSMFKKQDTIDLMELYKTTVLAETLDLTDTTFDTYCRSVLAFWDELPERSYSDEL